MKNPFVTNGYAGAEYFCDRAQENDILRELLLNENNIALISPRRVGKTNLIWHVFDDLDLSVFGYCKRRQSQGSHRWGIYQKEQTQFGQQRKLCIERTAG